jgi:hypothetical protein
MNLIDLLGLTAARYDVDGARLFDIGLRWGGWEKVLLELDLPDPPYPHEDVCRATFNGGPYQWPREQVPGG